MFNFAGGISFRLLPLAFVAVCCAGCVRIANPPTPVPPQTEQKVSPTQPSSRPQPKPTVPRKLIVIESEGSDAYARVTREVVRQWKGTVEVVSVNEEQDARVLQQVQSASVSDVIAIGLHAARAARSLSGKKVVFCQVFNYEGQDLIRPWMKGVSALPPVRQQFMAWKRHDPQLRMVAVIVGPGLDGLIAEARAAARENGITLRYSVVASDLELRSAAVQLGPEVQGLWLVPDNRVLSHRVLQEILSHSRSRGRQVLVINEQLLGWGATLSAESDPADIALRAISRLRAAEGQSVLTGADLVPLTRISVKTNKNMGEAASAASNNPGAANKP